MSTDRETRRHFLARSAALGTLALRTLHGQSREVVPIPGIEAGEPTPLFALRNVTVIDGTGKPASPGMTVVVAGKRIQSLAQTGTAALAPGMRVHEASGKFLIPGLWDMHVHWSSSRRYIANGVTGVRTMGGSDKFVQDALKLRGEIADGKLLGPRMVVASPTMWDPFLNSPEQGRLAVRKAIRDGADFIKVHDPLAREIYFAVADEAKKLGVTFVGHVPGSHTTLLECANAGQKSFEHMQPVFGYLRKITRAGQAFTGPVFSINVQDLSPSEAKALTEVFRRNRAWLCPTHSATPSEDQAAGQRHKDSPGLVGLLHKAGVGILAGTDTGPDNRNVLAGESLHEELRFMVRAGLTPMEAVRTATYKPAQFLGLLDSLGTIERGKSAELVLLDANPLADIANTKKISMVFTGGRVYGKAALDAMLKRD